MSNLEHLFENAIDALDHDKTYDEWVASEMNLNIRRAYDGGTAILRDEHIVDLFDIWTLANYVVYTHDLCIMDR